MEAVLSVNDAAPGVNDDGVYQANMLDVSLELIDVSRIDTAVEFVEVELSVVTRGCDGVC